MPKGSQDETQNDAKTHQKPMPKLVTEKIIQIIKIMFLWRVKSVKFIVKINVSDCLEGCMCER